jgi:predicted NBD/HSP70 family sugar kinase
MYILFDIGGTKMRLAASRDGTTFDEPKFCKTPADNFDEGMRLFAKLAREMSNGETITAAAGGIAGPLNKEKTKLARSPNIAGWTEKPLKTSLENILGAHVYLENDTAIVGLGEATAGAARGFEIAVYITVSTGVGGVRIVDGAIDRSAMGFEIGHQVIVCPEHSRDTATLCTYCNGPGHLEGYISGAAFERKYGKKPYEVTEATAWEDAARLLAYGLNNAIMHWSPDVIVLGGSMIIGKPAIQLNRIEAHLKDIVKIFPTLPVLKKAELGDVGGLHGALAYLQKITK